MSDVGPEVVREEASREVNAYQSPFERMNFLLGREYQPYTGTVKGVFEELKEAMQQATTQEHFARIALHPARIIRAVLNHKMAHQDSNVEVALAQAVMVALDIYKNNPDALQHVDELYKSPFIQDMLDEEVEEPSDPTTWYATEPGKSMHTAERLVDKTQGGEILFIPMAHGGIAAGLDVFARYTTTTGSEGSVFYPVKFSVHKSGDQQPQVSDDDRRFLQANVALGKKIVIFDEDISSGATTEQAQEYFSKLFGIPKELIIIETNSDARTELLAWGMNSPTGKQHMGEIQEFFISSGPRPPEQVKRIHDIFAQYVEEKLLHMTEVLKNDTP